MILYVLISYLVMLGALIEYNDNLESTSIKEWAIFLISPFVLPIIIGMMIAKK